VGYKADMSVMCHPTTHILVKQWGKRLVLMSHAKMHTIVCLLQIFTIDLNVKYSAADKKEFPFYINNTLHTELSEPFSSSSEPSHNLKGAEV